MLTTDAKLSVIHFTLRYEHLQQGQVTVNSRKQIRIVSCLLIILLFSGHNLNWDIPLTERVFAFIDQLERISYDIRLNATLPGGTESRIVIMDVDEKSLGVIGQWPWPRNIQAQMLDNLFEHYKVKVFGFDFFYPESDKGSGLETLEKLARGPLQNNAEYQTVLENIRPQLVRDEIFAKSLIDRKIVLGYVFDQGHDITKGALPKSIASIGDKWEDKLPFFKPKGYVGNLPILQKQAISGGFFDNPKVDADGIFRRVPMMQLYKGELYESLALATARLALGSPDLEIVVVSSGETEQDYNSIELLRLGERTIRVDESISTLVPFRGAYPSFKYVSALDVLKKQVDIGALRDKIVLFGSTAPGLQDLRATPVQEVFPGVEVHANIVAGIIDQSIKHTPKYTEGYELIVIFISALLMIAILPLLSPLWATAMVISGATLLITVNMLVWNQGVVLPLASSLLLLLILFIFQMSYGFFIETRNKRALSKVFGQYIPPELVDELDSNSQEISLEGESREMTVLFSDVRGFTTISEGLNPKELTQLMNEFLTPLTGVIHKNRGTIDKYMGDAIMAFWGAPLTDPYHAKNAVVAAIEMIKALDAQKDAFLARGWPELKVGIGINTGIMNVGNMGSQFRMAYTVMGDTVNLGSRLEGLTKVYGVGIIVNESVKAALPEFEFLELDRVLVKGKLEPVTIYEPLGYSIELENNIRNACKRFNKALRFYREKNWDTAESEIFSLTQSQLKREVYQIYLNRIMHYRDNPPPPDWAGVFVHTTK